MKSVTETVTPKTDETPDPQAVAAAPEAKSPISAKISKYAAYDKLQG